SRLPDSARVFKKVDSLARGNTASDIAAVAESRRVLISLALPHRNRIMRRGRIVAESGRELPNASCLPASIEVVPVDVLRREGPAALRGRGSLALDAETDEDLDLVAQLAEWEPDAV